MNLKKTKSLSEQEKLSIMQLWNKEYPQELNYQSLSEFQVYLEKLEDQFHMLLIEGEIIKGWYFDFIRNSERWFAAILDSSKQGKGYGTKLLQEAKLKRDILNGWVIMNHNYRKKDGSPYKSPARFYKKNGFRFFPEENLNTPKISAIKIQWHRKDQS